jgi:DNA polymerase I-like protein with 3'-5' exonuclease and polymerase domains
MQLTKELVYLEQNGMQFNKLHMMQEQFKMLNRMSVIDNKLTSIVGRSFRPGVSGDCNEVLCGHYGLPPMGFTKDEDELEEGADNTPSFDKYAMKAYEALPYGPKEVIQLIVEYRKLDKRNSAFVTPWLEKAIVTNGMQAMVHATYNQIVRTGRMSCSDPNAQQLDDFMASMIIPGEGNSIISTDASQIEFRMIVHYIQDMAAIAAYNNDPDADFHQLVATLCKIARKPAKTINFGTAFGEGMKKVIAQLSANEDIVKQVKDEVDAMGFTDDKMRLGEFTRLIAIRGKHVYETYHKTFPNLKKTTKEAEKACKGVDRRLGLANDSNHYYGYITNLYGRRRHLPYARSRTNFEERDPYDKAWLAFSTINQSSAADLMKERFVYLMRHVIKKLPIKPIAIVHDEMVFVAPDELANDPRTIRDMVGTLENPNANISVPIRWSIGVSNKNWLDAATVVKDGGQSKMLQYDKAELQGLEWART